MLYLVPHPDIFPLDRTNPLYVGNFFRLNQTPWRCRKEKQGFVLSLAFTWKKVSKFPIEHEFFLSSLHSQKHKAAFEKFFEIKMVGYSVNGKKSPSIVIPKRLSKELRDAVNSLDVRNVYYTPPSPPVDTSLTHSEVLVSKIKQDALVSLIQSIGRSDLLSQASWLIDQPHPIKFFFKKSGSLQARDTSVWPIRGIETWPRKLRKALFPTSVDIDGAFLQYLIQNLEKKNSKERALLKYPDLMRAFYEKDQYRLDLCNLLKLNLEEGLPVVKKLIMSIANGSRISEKGLVNRTGQYTSHQIIYNNCPHLTDVELGMLAQFLRRLNRQISGARRELCLPLLGEIPTRKSSKKIFTEYFHWEREARYALHKEFGGTGLHLHDGLEGIKLPDELQSWMAGLKVSTTQHESL